MPLQRCTVHKHRNLLAHAPKKLYDEISADYADMIYAKTVNEVDAEAQGVPAQMAPASCRAGRRQPGRSGRPTLHLPALPKQSQWKSIRTTNAIERLHEEFKRRIKTQCMLPCADTACMLFWALLASGQITLRKVDGWTSLHVAPAKQTLDLAA